MTFLYIFPDRFPLQEEMLKFIMFLNTNSFFEKIAKKNAMNNEMLIATNGRSEYQGFRARDGEPLIAVKIDYWVDHF